MTKRIDLKKLIKEPLLHFLLIGAALFLLFDWRGRPSALPGVQGDRKAQITINRDDVERVISQFERTWQREPSEEERKGLIEDLVRSEIYYREAVAIGLDRDDEVLKRRLRQKMEFIYEDISSWAEPTDAELTAFMRNHREKYLAGPQLAFRQVFFSIDKRGKGAEADARQALAQLAAGADPDSVGDATMLEAETRLSPLSDVMQQYGEEFGKQLTALKPGAWTGPVRSSYGLHLVFVKERTEPRLPDRKDVRESVKRDWLVEKQKDLKDAAYTKLRERYAVTVEAPKAEGAPMAAAAKTGTVAR